jgi:hypothetical protein
MPVEPLRDIVSHDGPFASVYLDVSHTTEDAARQDELRWQAAGAQLAEQGADGAMTAMLREAVLGSPPPAGEAGRAVIAAGGDVLVNQVLPLPPASPVTRFSDLPYLLPLLSATGVVPHVVVVADKVNGWLYGIDRHDREVGRQSVHGDERPVHPVGGGGMAHKNIEARAQETVRHHTKELATLAARLVGEVGAELLVVAGEVQARSGVIAALPEHCRRLATELDVDASAVEADPAVLSGTVRRLVAQTRAEHEDHTVTRLREGAAHGTAAAGLAAVTEALRMGQVEALMVTDPVLADRTVYTTEDRTQIALRRGDLSGTVSKQRADEALPAAAIATSASVLPLAAGQATDAPVNDGVAALLRFASP